MMKNIVRKCFALAQIRWASYTGNNKRKGWNADLPDSNITKHAIAAALKELCREKSFDKICIADITSTCGLNRQTFYYHFEDKYDLLNWIYYTEGFARLVDGITLENWDSHIAVLFETMRADKKFYENTVRCTPDTFGNYLFKVVRALFLEAVEALDNGTVPDADKAFFADFYAYGSCGTVRAWVSAGMKTPPEELARLARSRRPAWRVRVPEEVLSFRDLLQGGVSQDLSLDCGDFILRRSDGVYAYQLAVVVDDGAMGVTQVVRGSDLLDSTTRQLWLQERLGQPHPEYGHVPQLLAPDGRRLAKRDRDQELGALQSCYSAQELVGQLALLAGLIPEYAPISPAELIPLFSWEKLPQADCAVHWADGICTFFTKTIQSPVQRDRPPV